MLVKFRLTRRASDVQVELIAHTQGPRIYLVAFCEVAVRIIRPAPGARTYGLRSPAEGVGIAQRLVPIRDRMAPGTGWTSLNESGPPRAKQ